MNKTKIFSGTLLTVLLLSLNSSAQHVGTPMGFATVPAYGVSQTTGGKGGEVVIINGNADAKKLQDALDDDDKPRIIYIKGTVQLPEYPAGTLIPVEDVKMRMTCVKSNKTILGLGSDAKIVKSGFSIFSGSGEGEPHATAVNNVIIQNLTFEAAPDDAINIQGGSHHIWIDHCTFTDGSAPLPDGSADGQVDVKRGSDFVTVSDCYFTNHFKMCLVGHSKDAEAIDKGHLRVTYYRCHWQDKGPGSTNARHPRVRFGTVHVLNSLIEGRADEKCEGVVAVLGAHAWIQNTHFKNCKSGGETDEHEGGGFVKATNCTDEGSGPKFGYGTAFTSTEAYTYSINAEGSGKTIAGAVGAGILNIQQVSIENHTVALSSAGSSMQVDTKGNKINLIGHFNQNVTANIIDLSGRAVVSNRALIANKNGCSIGIADLTPGTYFLTTLDNSVIGKFNKQ